jgi:DNA polymerase
MQINQYKQLHQKIKTCQKCDLRKSCQQVVVGDGNFSAKLMFIGEAPGKKEDEIGEPFRGASGKFLNELLASVKLNRADIYITNIVKCRPPQNRDPKKQEIEICTEWLNQQIKIIRPKLIITLGRYSLQHFFPLEQISQAHGQFLQREISEIKNQNFYILYHPAAALYNGKLRKVLKKDFQKIKNFL